MNSSLTKNIFFDFFDGKTSSLQNKLIEEWLHDTANQEVYFQYLDEWESSQPQIQTEADVAFSKLLDTINNTDENETIKIIEPKPWSLKAILFLAAAASLFIASIFIMKKYDFKNNKVSYNKLIQSSQKETGEIYEKINLTDSPILVSLPDESSILLQPDSKISYSPKKFNTINREVILSGEAFFEITKDKEKPFYVFANEIITKVLGTSFTIKAAPESEETHVIVKTGQVEVFTQKDKNKAKKMKIKKLEGLILMPNESLSFKRKDYKLSVPTSIIPKKSDVAIQSVKFNFEKTPAIEVLEKLKDVYSVEINYNKQELQNCKLTALLTDEPLLEKIRLICFALNAEYEVSHEIITIKSNGCQP
ncbi:FecR family protein [uncultured Arcticibacterium sp.]|uniref:FecR family protein n=1 Tax=uncultured Arcticibacterium sp. TaxID=2173042 RepID=UPI0030F8D302